MHDVSIINYGIGNVLSVMRAFEQVGAKVQFVATPEEILNSTRIVLPGVGAFHKGMEELEKRGMVKSIQAFCEQDRPFLGICLGMQLMFETSEEFGLHKGLGIIPGNVKKIDDVTVDGEYQKVPHVGWNHLVLKNNDSIFDSINDNEDVYFVHSFAAEVSNVENLLSTVEYGGRDITAMIKRGNRVYGTQFHPEKSGKIGLKIIENFSKM